MNILLDEDYIGINETIQFEIEDREMIVQTLILDDSQLEDVEEFLAVLTPIAGVFPVAVQNGTAVVSIADNDGKKHLIMCHFLYYIADKADTMHRI